MTTEKKCIHRVGMKGHGKPWCLLHSREADCVECHGVAKGIDKATKLKNLLRSYGGTMQRWNQLNLMLQLEAARHNFENIDNYLMGRPGVQRVHDKYIIDTEKWVSLFTEMELAYHNNQLVRIIEINGPAVKIKIQDRNSKNYLDVWEWELEKRNVARWVRKQWRKLWHKA